ncbi:PadR family transcriptional regulator [Curtobacterium sp. TXMA1]|uniref:PadR family transcriptional regulator n=1 Tax=Curtobacterium sp. TXMA1 TaxID=2876939 RepID=UPI001CCF9467|nr:PadR family transcriptional regulator [Curtobacterium sp. TXMA1]UBQ02551.1 PadR family transcriptional regulator [Curtobacterium sp. TXMA1]
MVSSFGEQLRRASLRTAVLAALDSADALFGLDVLRTLRQSATMATTEGSIYPLLHRLEREGLVESSWALATKPKPRRYYRLTALGSQTLAADRADWSNFAPAFSDIITSEGTHE